jgi:hypothetical protein
MIVAPVTMTTDTLMRRDYDGRFIGEAGVDA